MREITESQLRYISGAGGAPATSANAAGAAAIVGALAGIPGGPLGVVVGADLGLDYLYYWCNVAG
ncbi:hypothetical protein, partial [Escherichia coli]|uniref:hypothetical protein n=1 Tax=Escherichia coli TaxID=562 RepID=UPI0011AC11C7